MAVASTTIAAADDVPGIVGTLGENEELRIRYSAEEYLGEADGPAVREGGGGVAITLSGTLETDNLVSVAPNRAITLYRNVNSWNGRPAEELMGRHPRANREVHLWFAGGDYERYIGSDVDGWVRGDVFEGGGKGAQHDFAPRDVGIDVLLGLRPYGRNESLDQVEFVIEEGEYEGVPVQIHTAQLGNGRHVWKSDPARGGLILSYDYYNPDASNKQPTMTAKLLTAQQVEGRWLPATASWTINAFQPKGSIGRTDTTAKINKVEVLDLTQEDGAFEFRPGQGTHVTIFGKDGEIVTTPRAEHNHN